MNYNGKVITVDKLYELSRMEFINELETYELTNDKIIDAENQFLKLDIELG